MTLMKTVLVKRILRIYVHVRNSNTMNTGSMFLPLIIHNEVVEAILTLFVAGCVFRKRDRQVS